MLLFSTWSAVGPLVGVGVGACLAFVGDSIKDSRRRKDEKEAKSERDERELRPAGRLVQAELADIDIAIREAMRTGRRPRFKFPNSAYVQFSPVLAARLETDPWFSVLGAYEMANDLNKQLDDMPEQLRDEDKALFRAPWLAIRQAEEALGQVEWEPDDYNTRLAAQRKATSGLEARYWGGS